MEDRANMKDLSPSAGIRRGTALLSTDHKSIRGMVPWRCYCLRTFWRDSSDLTVSASWYGSNLSSMARHSGVVLPVHGILAQAFIG